MGNTETNDLGKKKIGEGIRSVSKSYGGYPGRKANPGGRPNQKEERASWQNKTSR